MDTNQVQSVNSCSSAMKLLGDYWTLRIIDELKSGEARFCDLQRQLNLVNPVTLTKRLKLLEDSHLVSRQLETIDKLSVSYSLTAIGQETLPIIKALNRFSKVAKVN